MLGLIGGIPDLSSQQIFDPDWEVPNSHPGGVVYRIGNSGGCTDIGEFTQPLDARRINVFIDFRHENNFDFVECPHSLEFDSQRDCR